MNDNLNLKILEAYVDIDKLHDSINNKIFQFITKANELVELSQDMYQIEKSFRLNEISLKGYVLDSDCCQKLRENNISDYSINELRGYLTNYEISSGEDYSSYYLALTLYELLEEIKEMIDSKNDLEIKAISQLVADILNINNIGDSEYNDLRNKVKWQLENNYFKDGLIDEQSYSICIQITDEIFNYYINGYPHIPDEYLYHSEN